MSDTLKNTVALAADFTDGVGLHPPSAHTNQNSHKPTHNMRAGGR